MKRELRNLLIFVAATLSVIAIPLIAASVTHLNATLVASIVGATGAVVGASATGVYWAYSQGMKAGREAAARREAEKYSAFSMRLASDAISPGELFPTMERRLERLPEMLLLKELSVIEREARDLLGERQSTSIIRIRSRLRDSGVWSEEDVYDFDTALRVRNKVAHGDQGELTKTSLAEAIETMKRLRRKLEASQLAPPSN